MVKTTKPIRKYRGKYEQVVRKIEESAAISFSRWNIKVVARHLIRAGRMRLVQRELYDFPGYCRFPYSLYDNGYVCIHAFYRFNVVHCCRFK